MRWTVCHVIPGRRPRTAILDAIAHAVAIGDAASSLRLDLEEQPSHVIREMPQLRAGNGVVVFIDQLEDLLTVSDPAEAAKAAELIGRLSPGIPGLRILATVRSDYLSQLASLAGLRETIARALYLLPAMTPDSIRTAIVEPARIQDVELEPAAVDQLVVAGSQLGGLPLLQFTLAELWERRDSESGKITAALLAQLGGVEGALARHADDVIAKLRPQQRDVARDMLTRLVGPDRQRIECDARELASSSAEAPEVAEALIRGRLMTATETDRGPTLAIAHDTLVSGWGTLAEWLDTDAQRRRQRARIEDVAREWQRLGRPRDHLLAPSRLRELRHIGELSLSQDAEQLLAASRRARIARWALLSGAVVVAIGIASAAVMLARRADEVNARARSRFDWTTPLRSCVAFSSSMIRRATCVETHSPPSIEVKQRPVNGCGNRRVR